VGYDWTTRYPWIVEDVKNRTKHFVIDGEAVILGVDGISDFNALRITLRHVSWNSYELDGDGHSIVNVVYYPPQQSPEKSRSGSTRPMDRSFWSSTVRSANSSRRFTQHYITIPVPLPSWVYAR
jgi:hypothetical protein